MTKVKGLTKRVAAILMSGMLVVGAVPGTVMASENQTDIGQTSEIAAEVPEGANTEEVSAEAYSEDAVAQEEEAEAQYYTVTLDANGGYFENERDDTLGETVEKAEVVEKHIPVGGNIATVPVFTETDQDGQTMLFAGWSLEPDGELVSPAEEEYVPVDNCVLYAVWEATEDASWADTNAEGAGTADAAQETDAPEEAGDAGAQDESESAQESGDAELVEETGTGSEDTEQAEEPAQEFEDTETIGEADTVQETAEDEYSAPETDNEQDAASAQEVIYSDEKEEETNEEASDSAIVESSEEEEAVREDATKGVVESGTCGDNLTWTLDDAGTLTISGTGEISESAFYKESFSQYEFIKKVKIENGVTGIGDLVFCGCENMKEAILPVTVVSIGQNAFNSTGIEEITIPGENVQMDFAFQNCKSLRKATVQSAKGSEFAPPFYKCDNLTDLIIMSGTVGVMASYCDSLKNIVLGNGVTKIEKCPSQSITNIEIPDSVKEIDQYAFYNCQNLENISLGNGLTAISTHSFELCTNLREINIPDSVETIDFCAFARCSGLERINFGSGLTEIGGSAFTECAKLTYIEIPESVTVIEECAFLCCYALESVTLPSGLLSIENSVFNRCVALKDINIPDNVTKIGDYAFYGCNSLDSITIPSKVTEIGEYAFALCTPLESVIILDGVKSIGLCAFQRCENLKTVIIPNSVTYIGTSAFSDCGLTNVIIPDSVTELERETFFNCKQLKSVIIPLSVKSIGFQTFGACDNLQEASYLGTEENWASVSVDPGNTPLLNAIHFTNFPTQESFIVSFDANGGTGTPSSQIKNRNVALTLSNVIPTKKYVISYNANGGRVSPASKNINCTFKNWNTSKNGSGTSYASGGSYTTDADVTLYAQWTNPKAGDLASPTRSGYMFAGWFTSASGGELINDASTISKNMTVYAHWTDPYNLGDETYSFQNYGDSDSKGGHCFGMSITSSGYYTNLLDIGRIGGNANTPLYSFDRTQTVKRPICYYQGRQGSYSANAIVAGGSTYLYGGSDISSDWQAVVNYVKSHKYDNTGLLQIGFRKNLEGGHAINFLRYENINGQDRIYAYDNNFPDQETYFYQDSSGKVFQAPVQTFSGNIDCIALRDTRIYFNNVGDFDATHVVYMEKDATSVQGYSYSYMEGDFTGSEYVMYEIPADQDRVILIPNKDNADFIYMDTEFSFGNITPDTRGVLEFSSMDEQSGGLNASFIIYEESESALIPTVTLSKTTFTYNGKVQKPSVTVKAGSTVLTESRDYIVEYPSGMVDVGPYKVKVTLIGNYSGVLYDTFEIVKAAQPLAASNLSLTYAKTGTITASGNKGKLTYKSDNTSVATVDSAGKVTAKGVGTAKITITAAETDNYNIATKQITVTVAKAAQSITASNLSLTFPNSGKITASGNKGSLSYKSSNTAIATVDSAGKVTAKGAGKATITITAAATSNYNAATKTITVTVAKGAQSITAKAGASSVAVGKTTTVSITGAKGTKSYKSSDTTIATVTSAGKVTAKKVGTVKITATSAATAQYNAASKTVTIKVVPAATASLTAANQATGIKLTWKRVTGANGYKVYRGSTLIKTITSGSTVTYADAKANTNGTKYTYKVVAKASTGDSTLSKSVSVYRVARPAVSSVTNSASRKMTVKWGKNAKANGYQIQYSLSKTFGSGNKAVTVTSASSVSKAIGNLTKGKTYYVRIRTYKTVGSAKYWSVWSAAKSVKISK